MNDPLFSMIIPTYERPHQLEQCLQSLVKLQYPREKFEVIIVNDGGQMPLDEIVGAFDDQLSIFFLTQPNTGPAAARNTGAKKAKGKFLVFIDDDCLPAEDYLKNLEIFITRYSESLIGGQTVNAFPNNPYSVTSQIIIDVAYTYYNQDDDHARFFASNNMVVPADRFRALGGFDTNFRTSEDREFCDRWFHSGGKMIYAKEIILYHAHFLTLASLWRQHFNYGRGAFRFHQLRAKRGSGELMIEWLFYRDLLLYAFRQKLSFRTSILFFLILFSQMANLSGFLFQWLTQAQEQNQWQKKRPKSFFRFSFQRRDVLSKKS